MAKTVAPLVENLTKTPNKYNLKPKNEIRPTRMGSLSQEIGSIYDHLSDYYGVDFNDLVYGDKGFMKTKYPQGFPDFKGDLVYSQKYGDEFEKWAKENRGIDFLDRRWERYKLDPDDFEADFDPKYLEEVKKYGASIDPENPILSRPKPERWYF